MIIQKILVHRNIIELNDSYLKFFLFIEEIKLYQDIILLKFQNTHCSLHSIKVTIPEYNIQALLELAIFLRAVYFILLSLAEST